MIFQISKNQAQIARNNLTYQPIRLNMTLHTINLLTLLFAGLASTQESIPIAETLDTVSLYVSPPS